MNVGEYERRFDVFGSRVRLLIGPAAKPGALVPELAAVEVEVLMRAMHRALTRFEPGSELSRMNADPSTVVSVSSLTSALVEAAIEAARRSGGLVDATVIDSLEQAGYDRSLQGVPRVPLAEALKRAPARHAAGPDPTSRWREIHVDRDAGTVARPPGVRIDSGGSGKGLAADLAAARLSRHGSFVVDCGGDVRIGGVGAVPRAVEVGDPFDESIAAEIPLRVGAVATSGLRSRIWRHGDGFAHHLIDPATGHPAWTGLVQATAFAPTAREAETLAKAAVLAGPDAAPALLAERGGVLVHDDGRVEVVGSPGERTIAPPAEPATVPA